MAPRSGRLLGQLGQQTETLSRGKWEDNEEKEGHRGTQKGTEGKRRETQQTTRNDLVWFLVTPTERQSSKRPELIFSYVYENSYLPAQDSKSISPNRCPSDNSFKFSTQLETHINLQIKCQENIVGAELVSEVVIFNTQSGNESPHHAGISNNHYNPQLATLYLQVWLYGGIQPFT